MMTTENEVRAENERLRDDNEVLRKELECANDQMRNLGRQLADGWRPMDEAPKDGTEVRLKLNFPRGVPAYWDDELQTWVLSRPLHMESIKQPTAWRKE